MTGRIAHMNWGHLRAPIGDPQVAEFVDAIEKVNAIAARSPGYVWRVPDAEMDRQQHLLSEIGPAGRMISTLSVWDSAADFAHFVDKTLHAAFMKRRGNWFIPLDGPAHVIWPIADGHLPTVAEALAKRRDLARDGAGPAAYDLEFVRSGRVDAAPQQGDTGPAFEDAGIPAQTKGVGT